MEGEDFGVHCSFETCNQLDFLPIKCSSCKKQFCNTHFRPEAHFCKKENQRSDYFEDLLRSHGYIPIRKLGQGSYGCVFLCCNLDLRIFLAMKIIQKDKYDQREMDASFELRGQSNKFICEYIGIIDETSYQLIALNYCNMKSLDVIAKQPHITLPSYTLRALMKQIFEGMRAFHSEGFIHRDIKCDNILLHSPPGSGLVYVKIADFGFAKKEVLNNENTYPAGTRPYMSPEQFLEKALITQKVDMYALGITFFRIIAHKYPVNEATFKEQREKLAKLKNIERPPEIKDDILWDLLSKLLEFDPEKRITASEALQHPYFTSTEAKNDISEKQQDLAKLQKESLSQSTSTSYQHSPNSSQNQIASPSSINDLRAVIS
ncbi:MAG: putative Serine/threonine-protein kinase ATG1a [Streblomastix strix]|uniref:Putative Serine/threonine-protein kinase ATG1a n=1 Tax=Streblomastix strix TaxID=222440 RepID=A0A5J4W022_9EUKA|nr:MAG: putative Serine/threonine-protein kinase ATG1a [Streblomastix strix]